MSSPRYRTIFRDGWELTITATLRRESVLRLTQAGAGSVTYVATTPRLFRNIDTPVLCFDRFNSPTVMWWRSPGNIASKSVFLWRCSYGSFEWLRPADPEGRAA